MEQKEVELIRCWEIESSPDFSQNASQLITYFKCYDSGHNFANCALL
jgi:hypothetical protein